MKTIVVALIGSFAAGYSVALQCVNRPLPAPLYVGESVERRQIRLEFENSDIVVWVRIKHLQHSVLEAKVEEVLKPLQFDSTVKIKVESGHAAAFDFPRGIRMASLSG